jgi:hypothetical protein
MKPFYRSFQLSRPTLRLSDMMPWHLCRRTVRRMRLLRRRRKMERGANNGCGYPWSVPSVTFVPSLVRRRSPTHRGQAKRELEHAALPTLRTNSPLLDPPFVHPRAFSRNQQTPKHRVELVLRFLEAVAPCYTAILIIATLDE